MIIVKNFESALFILDAKQLVVKNKKIASGANFVAKHRENQNRCQCFNRIH